MSSQSFNIVIPRRDMPLGEALARAPRAFREQAQKGFRVLAALGSDHHRAVIDGVMAALENRQSAMTDLGKRLLLSPEQTSGLFAAAMLLVPLLVSRSSPEEFKAEAIKVGFLPLEVAEGIMPFAGSVLENKEALNRAIRRSSLSSQVWPSLSGVDIVVDVRMDFEDEEVFETMPVAVCHIETDTDKAEIWFQASKSQMEHFRSDLDEAIKRMEIAETWARKGRPA